KGLDENMFFLARQPLAALNAAEHGAHCEILLRLRDPDSGAGILRGRFLPAAERYRLSPRIDRWVIDRTLSFLAGPPERLPDLLPCSINRSGLSLSQPELKDYASITTSSPARRSASRSRRPPPSKTWWGRSPSCAPCASEAAASPWTTSAVGSR